MSLLAYFLSSLPPMAMKMIPMTRTRRVATINVITIVILRGSHKFDVNSLLLVSYARQ